MAQWGSASPPLKGRAKSPGSKSPKKEGAKSPLSTGGQPKSGSDDVHPTFGYKAQRFAGAVSAVGVVGRALLHERGKRMTRAKLITILVIPLLFLVIPLYYRTKASWCGYCMLIMAIYWASELLPLAVTALLPIVMFPLTGILDVESTTKNYFNKFFGASVSYATASLFTRLNTNIGVVIFCSMVFAAALEVTHLDQRIALNTLRTIGTSYSRIMLGLMGVTMFLSMWVPNTAATSIVCPIVLTVSDFMKSSVSLARKAGRNKLFAARSISGLSDSMLTRTRNLMLLSVAYASNIGGTGSLIGTPPNIIMAGLIEKRFPTAKEPSFVSWMVYNVPTMLILLLCAWLYMRKLLYEVLEEGYEPSKADEERIMKEVIKRCDDLGHITFSESVVIFLLTLMVLLTFTQRPHFIPGWSDAFPYYKMIKSSVPMVVVMTMLFIVPRESSVLGQEEQGIISWDEVSSRVNWGTILLICGGMTIADASTKSGLSDLMVVGLEYLDPVPDWLMVVLLCLISSMLTELTSNSAICKLMLPVVIQNAVHRRVHPLYFGIPTTIGCSFAFMLPGSTPPNAIVYHMGHMSPGDMAGPGFVMNIICVSLEIVAINTWGSYVYSVNQYPEWARTHSGQD